MSKRNYAASITAFEDRKFGVQVDARLRMLGEIDGSKFRWSGHEIPLGTARTIIRSLSRQATFNQMELALLAGPDK